MGRLVQNHSTHIEGLIKWLKKIAVFRDIKTITPASLSKTNGRVDDDRLKSGGVLQSEIVIGDVDKRMFSNALGAENLVIMQVDWLKLEATDLTELLDSI